MENGTNELALSELRTTRTFYRCASTVGLAAIVAAGTLVYRGCENVTAIDKERVRQGQVYVGQGGWFYLSSPASQAK